MYNINVEENQKVIYVVCKGMIQRPEALELLDKLTGTFTKLSTSKYNLIIDSREVKTSPADVVDVLQKVMGLYANTPFKKKYHVVPQSAVTKMQNRNNDTDGFLSSLILVSSYDEAIAKISQDK